MPQPESFILSCLSSTPTSSFLCARIVTFKASCSLTRAMNDGRSTLSAENSLEALCFQSYRNKSKCSQFFSTAMMSIVRKFRLDMALEASSLDGLGRRCWTDLKEKRLPRSSSTCERHCLKFGELVLHVRQCEVEQLYCGSF